MTDLEILWLCAEAMEPPATLPGSSNIWGVTVVFKDGEKITTAWVRGDYDPLHNDAQAMALWKRFMLEVSFTQDGIRGKSVHVWRVDWAHRTSGTDLNRAICECVAKMQAAKK